MAATICRCIGHFEKPFTWVIDIPDPDCAVNHPTP